MFLHGKPLAMVPQPLFLETPGERRHLPLVLRPQTGQRGASHPGGGTEGKLWTPRAAATGGRFAEILIPWAKAESRAEQCVLAGGRRTRTLPSAGWNCLSPAEAPAPLLTPPPVMSPCITEGTPGLVSPINSGGDIPSFLFSLSPCCRVLFTFSVIHVRSWQQMVVCIK